MNTKSKKLFTLSAVFFILFALFTVAVKLVDVQSVGPMGSCVGFGKLNAAFNAAFPYSELWYDLTDFCGYIAILVCVFFGAVGAFQLFITRKSLLKVDRDILYLGIFYIIVIALYVIFNHFAINYRPVILDAEEGLEASYPSSHTMLIICVMATAAIEAWHRFRDKKGLRSVLTVLCVFLLAFTVIGRLVSGAHWLTDIIGSCLISAALVCLYAGAFGTIQEPTDD